MCDPSGKSQRVWTFLILTVNYVLNLYSSNEIINIFYLVRYKIWVFLQIKIKKSLMLFQNVTKCVGCVVCDNAAMKRCPAQYRKKMFTHCIKNVLSSNLKHFVLVKAGKLNDFAATTLCRASTISITNIFRTSAK